MYLFSYFVLWFLFAGIRVNVKRMDRTPGKDQPMCDKRASGGADFSRAVPEYFSQLVRNLFFSVMSFLGGGGLSYQKDKGMLVVPFRC